eukprot:g3887.t1
MISKFSSTPSLASHVSIPYRSRIRTLCSSHRSETTQSSLTPTTSRRSQLLSLVVGVPLTEALITNAASAAKIPRGFNAVQDKGDGYQFLAPFGWQEVDVKGLDVVYKDLIEPLESVSVSLIPTDKTSIKEFGDLDEVAYTLADKVLTPPDQTVKIIEASERMVTDTDYYQFEFETKAPNYVRHALGVVAIGNGMFYALTTGASEKRWKKIADRLRTVIKSFQVIPKTVE